MGWYGGLVRWGGMWGGTNCIKSLLGLFKFLVGFWDCSSFRLGFEIFQVFQFFSCLKAFGCFPGFWGVQQGAGDRCV